MDINEKIEARRRELAAAKELERSKNEKIVAQQKMQLEAAKANEEKTVNSDIGQQNKEKKHINEKNAPEEDIDDLIEDELEKRITFSDKLPGILGIIFAIILWSYDAGFIPVMLVLILCHLHLWHVKKTLRKAIAEDLKQNSEERI